MTTTRYNRVRDLLDDDASDPCDLAEAMGEVAGFVAAGDDEVNFEWALFDAACLVGEVIACRQKGTDFSPWLRGVMLQAALAADFTARMRAVSEE
jgi:hypothetical protein